MNKNVIAVLAVTMALLATAATRHRATLPPGSTFPLSLTRSFAVTDVAILQGFPFARVVDAIAARSGVAGATGGQLIRQMFDTQNPRPGMADPAAPHCDDFLILGEPTFNSFPRRCPTPEATLLAATPFSATDYVPLALINRFDMAPADGANCGQYRMIYVTYPAPDKPPANHRIHINFESVLPNPHPEQGIAGCRAVAQFWADLSSVDSMSERRARLEQFFFDGIPGFEPVVHPNHYTLASGGGIRTRENLQGRTNLNGTRFYQFRVEKQCPSAASCTLRLVPDLLENVPWGPLFSGDGFGDKRVGAFHDDLIAQVKTLAINDVNQFHMNVRPQFLLVESNPDDDPYSLSYSFRFHYSDRNDGGKFRAQIDAELKRIGSNLTAENIVARAETQACHGCHAPSGSFDVPAGSSSAPPVDLGGGVVFPAAVPNFGHIDDLTMVAGEGGPASRFQISPAMKDVFIPNRMRILREFLLSGKPPEHSN
jgi:hypothetical protein